jgi:homoaconitate hydratase
MKRGALAGVFPVDHITLDYMSKRISRLGKNHSRYNYQQFEKLSNSVMEADEGAEYYQVIEFDLSTVEPFISGPNSVKKMQRLLDLQRKKIKVDKAYLVSCVNSRASDIKAAAEVLKDKKVASNVEFYVAAASSEVERDAKIAGDWQILLNAGAKPLVSGCGPCIGNNNCFNHRSWSWSFEGW